MIIALQTLIFFRETLVRALDAFLRPYYKNFSFTFTKQNDSDDEGSEDQVYAEYHEEKGVVFFPPVYVQRYAAVTDCLMDDVWYGKLEKVADFGYHDMSFIKYLKEVPGIQHIMGVDIETIPIQSSSDLLSSEDYMPKRENPLKVTLFQGNAADPDYRLIGCDAVIAIEMIEHMLPHDLDRFVQTVFGFIKPWVVVLTTPNGDFNVLFKSMEKNGLRRLDHFFEWSREQYHDWCTNIVLRYPQYSVSCKGIGPGPPDTAHLGCCSQMAIFVSKNYIKQQDLDPNSLALVASKDVPSLSLDDMTSSYECIPDNNMLCITNDIDLYPELTSNKQSCVTIVLTSPMYSYHAIEYTDKAFQCNLDTEVAKGFLFENETPKVLLPRRKTLYRIYEFEDVNNRLNCTTLQVKKFSKTTQNMMAKNKIDSLVHTREVVDEIRHLTKMLNFDKSCKQCGGDHIWHNFNWGENAPYWNEYYKVVRDYNYPFETKSDECRILDLICEEINSLVDKQWDDEFPAEINRLEIPIDHLMKAVVHITDDVDKVKELLEWNGYQIVGDLVVHSRLIVDTTSIGTHDDDWADNETVSDWDTSDVRSSSLSDGSTNVPDFYGRCLRRALDHKVRKLRTLLLADEDISSELDRVVCRLMKLALHTSKYRQTPVPASWVQCKLFDLLTLTEKAIERRRKNYIQEYSIKAIENGQTNDQYVMALAKVKKENERADEIMFKYRHLVNPSELILEENFHVRDNSRGDLDTEDDNEFFQATDTYKDDEMSDIIEFNEGNESNTEKPKTKLDIVREWIGVNKSPLYNKDIEAQNVVTFKSDHESCTSVSVDKIDGTSVSTFDSAHNLKFENKQIKNKRPETKIAKKSSKKKLNYTFLLKNYYIKFGDTKSKKKCKDHQRLQSNAIAPIPSSLISLCEKAEEQIEETSVTPMLVDSYSREVTKVNENHINIAATENSNVISIITQETEEEVVLRRSIGTDPDAVLSDQEADLETVINVTKQDSLNVLKENDNEDAQSQTIFLYDINEPSTSKGIRHAGLDAQCGPDDITHCSMLSATTSFSKLPKLFSKGIKIEHSKSTLYSKKMFDTGTSPDTTLPHHVFTGIRINDSDTMLTEKYKTETATMTLPLPMLPGNNVDFFGDTNNKPMETTLIKPAPAHVQATKPLSDLYEVKSPIGLLSPINKSNVQIQFCKNDNKQRSPTRIRSKLSCGGIYVHSFKDKEVSEDVVFQGGWNELTPNALTKKNIKKSTTKKAYYTSKKVKRGSNTSDKNHSAKNELNIASKRPVQIRTQRQTLKKEPITKILPSGKSAVPIRSRPNKFNRNDRKVPPNIRESYAPKKPISYREYLLRSRPNGIPNIENYLPPYLKRNRSSLVGKRFLSQSIDSVRPADNNIIAPFMRSKTEEIKRDVVKRVKVNSRISSKFVSYQVFRNEIENKRIVDIDTDDMDRESLGNNSTPKRSCSPESQNSSDSSPSTVRAVSSICKVNDSNKTCTTSAHYIKPTPEFKSNFSSKIKNIIKKSKNEKKIENKENIPEDASNKVKRGFLGTTKNIFRAHMNAESSPLHSVPLKLSKSRSQFKKSPPKLPNIKSSSKLLLQSTTSLSSKKINNDESCIENNVVLSSPTDTVLISDSHKDDDLKVKVVEISLNNNLSPELIKFQSLENSIKLMLEEEINTICSTPKNSPIIAPFDDNDSSICIGNETLSYNTSSPSSFKTVIENDVSSDFKLNLEEAVYNSINNTLSSTTINIRDTVKTDVKSFESVCSSSKHSEYFLADQDLYDFSTTPDDTKSSLHGIFKRKDLNTVLNIGGPIALQAFSGFSMNAASLAGDQPEYISLVDPETRIMQEVSRQAESEEILISGRSSDTYESCYVEEDSFIPSWLFNIISHQQSAEESEDEDNNLIPFPLPLVERVFDLNADEEGAIGAGAGAGDGRGMHSDNSQDSSGRGTSLSSSETSTDTPSEAILVDPSALVAHYEYIRETVDSPNLDRPTESPDTSFMTADADNGDENRQRIRTRTVGSDIDADVSSLDTDAADSDI